MWTYTPFSLITTSRAMIAPFFADVDTRDYYSGGIPDVTYGQSTVDGRAAFGVNWPGVGYYWEHATPANWFQLVLIERFDTGPGNFDIEFNYNSIGWETGDARARRRGMPRLGASG